MEGWIKRLQPAMANFLPEALGEKVKAVLYRNILKDRLIKYLDSNTNMAFAYTMGSTARGEENEYSDTDVGVVVWTDNDLNCILNNEGRAYRFFGEIVGYYHYNPYHSYVVYQGPLGPMPLDIYYTTEEMYNLMRSSDAVVIVDHMKSVNIEPEQKNIMIQKMILDCFDQLQIARFLHQNGEEHEVVRKLSTLRSTQLLSLLRLVEGYNIPHVKAVRLSELDPEIRDLFIKTFARPNKESIEQAFQAFENLFMRIIQDADVNVFDNDMIDVLSHNIGQEREDVMFSATGNRQQTVVRTSCAYGPDSLMGNKWTSSFLVKVAHIFDTMFQVGFVTYERSTDGKDKVLVIMQDDDSLNFLVNSSTNILEEVFPESIVEHLSPVHLRIKDKSGQSLDIFLTSLSLYYTSRRNDNLMVVDNRGVALSSNETVFKTETDLSKMSRERELIVKGVVRVFRLLSKIKKEDFVTFTHIMDDIRDGQLVPLMKQAGIDPIKDPLFPFTYCQPTAEGVRESVKAAMILFADAYLHIRDEFELHDLDVYMQRAINVVLSFTD
jgi:predicted nucleotidyltransferase